MWGTTAGTAARGARREGSGRGRGGDGRGGDGRGGDGHGGGGREAPLSLPKFAAQRIVPPLPLLRPHAWERRSHLEQVPVCACRNVHLSCGDALGAQLGLGVGGDERAAPLADVLPRAPRRLLRSRSVTERRLRGMRARRCEMGKQIENLIKQIGCQGCGGEEIRWRHPADISRSAGTRAPQTRANTVAGVSVWQCDAPPSPTPLE